MPTPRDRSSFGNAARNRGFHHLDADRRRAADRPRRPGLPTVAAVAPVGSVSVIVAVVTVMAVLKTVMPWLPSDRS
jgi:hypothetical protein